MLGAGLVGICTALALREQGRAVTLIDRDAPGQGASMGNAGVISPWSCIPQSMPGVMRKVPGWLLDPEGPVALRVAYAPRMLGWLGRFVAAGQPARLPAIADAMTGFYTALGILAALNERNATGKGRLVETSMFEAMCHFNLDDFTHLLSVDEVMGQYSRPHVSLSYVFECADG